MSWFIRLGTPKPIFKRQPLSQQFWPKSWEVVGAGDKARRYWSGLGHVPSLEANICSPGIDSPTKETQNKQIRKQSFAKGQLSCYKQNEEKYWTVPNNNVPFRMSNPLNFVHKQRFP